MKKSGNNNLNELCGNKSTTKKNDVNICPEYTTQAISITQSFIGGTPIVSEQDVIAAKEFVDENKK